MNTLARCAALAACVALLSGCAKDVSLDTLFGQVSTPAKIARPHKPVTKKVSELLTEPAGKVPVNANGLTPADDCGADLRLGCRDYKIGHIVTLDPDIRPILP